jgi:hypothetical protein
MEESKGKLVGEPQLIRWKIFKDHRLERDMSVRYLVDYSMVVMSAEVTVRNIVQGAYCMCRYQEFLCGYDADNCKKTGT